MQAKITKKLVESISRPEQAQQIFLRDTEIVGFGIRITSGARTFILEKRIAGRPRRISLGPYPSLSVEDARQRAMEMIGDIAKGKDPAQERNDFKGEPTFETLLDLYKERHLPRKKSAKNDQMQIKAYLDSWRNRKLSSVKRKDVVTLHLKIGEENGHYAANRLIALLRKMFNLARIWGIYQGENPATGVELFKEEKRERFIKPEEVPALMEALKREPNFYIRSALLTLLLIGQRKNEVLRMKWADVDLNSGAWRIPETKPKRSHLVPLPKPVWEMLKLLPRVMENPYVFPGAKAGRPLVNIDKRWREIRTKAGLPGVRIHDLRRTVGSWLAGSGASLPLIGKTLGHSQPQTTQIYARFDIGPVREALNRYAEDILMIAEGGKSEKAE